MPLKPITDRDLYRYSQLNELPEFVKAASLPDLLGDVVCGDADFADREGRTHATHTKAATWVSLAHLLEHGDRDSEPHWKLVQARLDAAASFFGIRHEIEDLRQKYAALQVPVADHVTDSEYGWLVKNAEGQVVERRLRISTTEEVKMAAAWVLEHRDRFLFADRMKIARRILSRADETNTSLGDSEESLYKLAGYGVSTLTTILPTILHRAALLRPRYDEAAESFCKLAETLQASPEVLRQPARLVKLATVLDQIDRDLGLQQAYKTEALSRSEDAVFAITEKTAREFVATHVELPSGDVYRRSDLEQLHVSDLREKLGDTIAEASTSDGLTVDAEKFAAMVKNMPPGPQLKAAMTALVGQAVLKGATVTRITKVELRRLAAQAD